MTRELTRSTLLILGVSILMGSWLVFEGSRKIVTGLYVGEDTVGLGPWASITSALGVSPDAMAAPFILFGLVWPVNSAVLFLQKDKHYVITIVVSVLNLFYLVPGTILSLAALLLALRERRRRGSPSVRSRPS
jgi:hypothetical protein